MHFAQMSTALTGLLSLFWRKEGMDGLPHTHARTLTHTHTHARTPTRAPLYSPTPSTSGWRIASACADAALKSVPQCITVSSESAAEGGREGDGVRQGTRAGEGHIYTLHAV
jgi:hypothetical protein